MLWTVLHLLHYILAILAVGEIVDEIEAKCKNIMLKEMTRNVHDCLSSTAQCKVLLEAQTESCQMKGSTENRMQGYVTAIKTDVQ